VTTDRAELIAEAAITILAERGMRGLTHRAVDEAAGLPTGSTSNRARTRAALLELALARLTEREKATFAGLVFDPSPGQDGAERPDLSDLPRSIALPLLADMMARAMHTAVTVERRTTIARYELALEATRRPELRKVYDEAGRLFRELAVAMLSAAGSSDPVRHGHRLVAFGEGILFDAVVGAGATPTLEDLQAIFQETLRGILTPAPQ
jgi:DNA-binding transcriptional regulator YbjK